MTLLHAANLSYFHHTCKRLMIWWCGWGKPFVTTKLLRLNPLMKILLQPLDSTKLHNIDLYENESIWSSLPCRWWGQQCSCYIWLWCCFRLLVVTREWRWGVGSDSICWDLETNLAIRIWSMPVSSLIVLFCCKWVKNGIDNKGKPTYKWDDVGFLLVNFQHSLHEFYEPFVFASQV